MFLACKPPYAQNKIIGVKIYNHEGNFQTLINEWKSIGINTAFVSKDLLANKDFRSKTEKNEINTFVILPIFFDEHLDEHPEFYAIKSDGKKAIDEWVKFACPSNQEYRKNKINSIIKIVEEDSPDGISIDFIRHFVFWEKVYSDTQVSELPNTCFCNSCINVFCEKNNINIPKTFIGTHDISSWILGNHSSKWRAWKCDLITKMIEEIVKEVKKVKPDVLVNVHIVPWKTSDFNNGIRNIAGQDLKTISLLTDYLSPMTYSHMVKQNAHWVHDLVENIFDQTNGNILPSIQVKEAYLDDTISSREFEDNLKSAITSPSSGVVFWSWEHLEQDPWKKDIIKRIIDWHYSYFKVFTGFRMATLYV